MRFCRSDRWVRGLLALGLLPVTALMAGRQANADTTFPQTGYSMWGPFETYWKGNGGLAQFGLPRTSVYHAGKDFDAQFFERAVFTYNPAKPDPYKVELNLLGSQITASRRGEAPFASAKAAAQATFFAATSHNLSGKFLQYWQASGGLPIYGYPVSEPFMEQSKSDGKLYLVQYFERNRFELHPELAGTRFEVQLGLLGSELLDSVGGPKAIDALGSAAYYPAASSSINVPGGGYVDSPNAGTPAPNSNTPPPAPALPPTDRPVLLSADFATSDLSGWTPSAAYSPPDATAPTWRVNNGVLEQNGIGSDEGPLNDALLLTNSAGYADATVDAYLYARGESAGLFLRYSANGYYLLKVYGAAPNSDAKVRLSKTSPSKGETLLASSTAWPGYSPRTWYRLTLSAKGSELTVSIDGQQLIKASDTQFSSGKLGFYAHADGTAKFDNLRVTAP